MFHAYRFEPRRCSHRGIRHIRNDIVVVVVVVVVMVAVVWWW